MLPSCNIKHNLSVSTSKSKKMGRSFASMSRLLSVLYTTWTLIGLFHIYHTNFCLAVVPTGLLTLEQVPHKHLDQPKFGEFLAAPSRNGGWGGKFPRHSYARWNPLYELHPRTALGCNASDFDHASVNHATVIVDRGNCSFSEKAANAQNAGASAIVIRSTKEAIYNAIHGAERNDTTSLVATVPRGKDTSVVKPPFEYDCSHGEAYVPTLETPAWETDHPTCYTNNLCESDLCVATGVFDSGKGGHQLCCMWDKFIIMGAQNTSATRQVSIPVGYITIAEGLMLHNALAKYPDLLMKMSERPFPLLDFSSITIWALGVATALAAAYYSAAYERYQWKLRTHRITAPAPTGPVIRRQSGSQEDNGIWEIEAKHAVAFIICAGLFLTLLYYVNIGVVLPLLFCIASFDAFGHLVAVPAWQFVLPSTLASKQFKSPSFITDNMVSVAEIAGYATSLTIAALWYVHRRTWWAIQDTFGVCLCFVFLRNVRLPSLKVGLILLSLAFAYDVFFVFISPLLFGSSVMQDVATGGPPASSRKGYPGVDFCERYPDYPACVDPELMPMLLQIPRFFSWLGGSSLLGLGDIILPGMLLSFALRADYSEVYGGSGYYTVVGIAYAVGLAMANVAVALTQTGQPALMYLVPLTLGTLTMTAWQNPGDLRLMWDGVDMEDVDDMEKGLARTDNEGRVDDPDEAPLLAPSTAR